MNMLSYAQHGEDVVLARLFARRERGRYVDAGAGSPVEDSVTKHFYDRGWSGINIEPVPSTVEQLRRERPRDVTLPVAVGATAGIATLNVIPGEWGRATLDESVASRYRKENRWSVEKIQVDVVTLASIMAEYPGEIDFLKIDVEGSEYGALAGADLMRFRPRVVLVEATRPGESTPSHEHWEPLLNEAGYRCALFDGLNRFYAQSDDAEALACLAVPANVFDEFEHHHVHAMRQALARIDEVHVGEVGYIRGLQETIEREREARVTAEQHSATLQEAVEDHVRQKLAAQRYAAALEQRIAELESARP